MDNCNTSSRIVVENITDDIIINLTELPIMVQAILFDRQYAYVQDFSHK